VLANPPDRPLRRGRHVGVVRVAALGLLVAAATCVESGESPRGALRPGGSNLVDASAGGVVRLADQLGVAKLDVPQLAAMRGELGPADARDLPLHEEFAADASWPHELFDGLFRQRALTHDPQLSTTPHVTRRPEQVDGLTVARIESASDELSTIVPAGADETWLVRARVRPLRTVTKKPAESESEESARRAGLAYVPICTPLPKVDEIVARAKELAEQWKARPRVARVPADAAADATAGWRELRLLARPYPGRTGLVVSLVAGEQGLLADWLEVRRLTPIETLALTSDESVEPPSHPLHRHVDVGMETWDALALPSGSTVEWSVALPRTRPRLELASGALAEATSPGSPNSAKVTLTVVVGEEGRKQRLTASRVAEPPSAPASAPVTATNSLVAPTWTLDLEPFAGRTVTLALGVEGPPSSVGLFLAPTLLGSSPTTTSPPRARNVLLISIDTLRADHLGCYGAKEVRTPRIDALAHEGVRFSNVLSPASYTLPTHLSMLSGQDPLVHETVRPNEPIDFPRTAMVARRLADAGVRTAAFTGGGLVSPRYGFGLGFDVYSTRDPGGVVGLLRFTGEDEDQDAKPGEDRLARAVDFLERSRDVPFFAFVHTYLAHNYRPSQRDLDALDPPGGPRPTPQELGELRTRAESGDRPSIDRMHALYRASIAQADREIVGRLLDALERLKLADSTLVVLVADHGEEFFEHAMLGHSTELWHDLTHVPWIVRGPGVPRGVVRTDPVSLADVAATIAGRFALAPEPRVLSRDQLPHGAGKAVDTNGQGDPRRDPEKTGDNVGGDVGDAELAAANFDEARVLSLRDVKDRPDQDALVLWPWKLVVKRSTPEPSIALYRLDDDPGETHDRAAEEPQRVAGMRRRLAAKLAEAKAKIVALRGTSDPRVFELTAAQQWMLDHLGYLHGNADDDR
jgi:arylsulfatase A-like enzyme